jgi:hypothetical protein
VSAENIVLRLVGTERYTTPDADGSFAFYNLPEGSYELAIDDGSLPENCRLTSAPLQQISLRLGAATPPVQFTVAEYLPEKPVRTLFEGQIQLDKHTRQ